MHSFNLKTPVVFIIFKRPEVTQRVFQAIRQAKPQKLYIFADGPRDTVEGEAELCERTRQTVEQIDWSCEVYRDYSRVNLGVEKRVISGLNIVFEREETAIVLEDDCLPKPSFFPFCQELLIQYEHDQRIMSISGSNFQFGRNRTSDSYYYSKFPSPWGWATWRRAWALFDENLRVWPELQKGNWLYDVLKDRTATQVWTRILQDCYYKGPLFTWDYIWKYICWINNGLAITSNVNLITNIGFGEDATHTKTHNVLSNIPSEEIPFPLVHPKFMICNERADQSWIDLRYGKNFGRDIYVKKWLSARLNDRFITDVLHRLSVQRVALIGTMEAARYLYKELKEQQIQVVAYLDNNPSMQGKVMDGVEVFPSTWLHSHGQEIDMIISTILGDHELDVIESYSKHLEAPVQIISWVDLVAWSDIK